MEPEGTSKPEESVGLDAGLDEDRAKTERAERRTKVRREMTALLKDLGFAAALFVFTIVFVARPFTVEGTSMLPTLEDGQRIIVNEFVYRFKEIERGDIVVFYYPLDPSKSFIKRVVGLPGDTVEIIDGFVLVNGEKVREPYVLRKYREHEDMAPVHVQMAHYWVMGDHRNGSNDSRSGWQVPVRYIYGKAFLRYWPLDRIGGLE